MNLSLREKAQAYQHWKVATCTAGAALIESVLASALAGVATADLSQVDLGQSFEVSRR